MKKKFLRWQMNWWVGVLTSSFFLPPSSFVAAAATFTWEFQEEGVVQKAVVQVGAGGELRVDRPKDRWSLIYFEKEARFVGIEHRDGTWWEFRWSDVQARMKDIQGLKNKLTAFATDDVLKSSAEEKPEELRLAGSGVMWTGNEGRRKAYGVECQVWKGTVPPGDPVEVVAQPGVVPGLERVITLMAAANEPMLLVATRPLAPSLLLVVTDALRRGGCTAREIDSGLERNRIKMRLLEMDPDAVSPTRFQVPKNFRKVPLLALETLLGTQEKE